MLAISRWQPELYRSLYFSNFRYAEALYAYSFHLKVRPLPCFKRMKAFSKETVSGGKEKSPPIQTAPFAST